MSFIFIFEVTLQIFAKFFYCKLYKNRWYRYGCTSHVVKKLSYRA